MVTFSIGSAKVVIYVCASFDGRGDRHSNNNSLIYGFPLTALLDTALLHFFEGLFPSFADSDPTKSFSLFKVPPRAASYLTTHFTHATLLRGHVGLLA